VAPTTPAGELTAKYTPGCRTQAAINAMIATKLSSSIGAVADGPGVPLRDHLGRGAGGDQRVEAGDGAAGDGDEAEGEDLAGEDRPGAVDEAGERGHLQLRPHEQMPTPSISTTPSLTKVLR
jgi:hypothetical protein